MLPAGGESNFTVEICRVGRYQLQRQRLRGSGPSMKPPFSQPLHVFTAELFPYFGLIALFCFIKAIYAHGKIQIIYKIVK